MSHKDSPETLSVLCTRGVTRHYSSKLVDDSLVNQMLAAMLAAPTSSNKQAWSFVVVRNPRNVQRVRAFSPGIIGTPTLMVVARLDTDRLVPQSQAVCDSRKLCVALAVENLLIAAHALDLGACPTASFRGNVISVLLGLPPHIEPVLIVPIGYPAKQPTPSKRRDKSEVISYERWGQKTIGAPDA